MATSMRCVCDTCNTHKILDNTKHIIYTDFDRYPFIWRITVLEHF